MEWYGQSIKTGGGSENPIDQILWERYFRGTTKGTAVEAGANDGLYLSTCLAFENIGWKVFNIEASRPNFTKLQINRPYSINLNVALWDSDNADLEIQHFDGDNGGADKVNLCSTEFSKRFHMIHTWTASAKRYDSIILEPVELFVLDVEGSEIQAIRGMGNTKFWPQVFCIEYPHVGVERLQAELGERYVMDYKDGLNAIFVRQE
jgi:FkbM family methyltransferase